MGRSGPAGVNMSTCTIGQGGTRSEDRNNYDFRRLAIAESDGGAESSAVFGRAQFEAFVGSLTESERMMLADVLAGYLVPGGTH